MFFDKELEELTKDIRNPVIGGAPAGIGGRKIGSSYSFELECISNLSTSQNMLFYMDSIYCNQNGL